MLANFFKKKEILPEVFNALNNKLPDKVEVEIKEGNGNYYFVNVKNLPGCVTQARSPRELFEMVNDAIYTYFEVPEQYQPFLKMYIPPENVRQKYSMKIQSGNYVLKTA